MAPPPEKSGKNCKHFLGYMLLIQTASTVLCTIKDQVFLRGKGDSKRMNESLGSSHINLGLDFVFASYKLYEFERSVFKTSGLPAAKQG